MSFLFSLALIILACLVMTRLTGMLKLPHVTAYLVAGLLLGPSFLNVISHEFVIASEIFTTVALGFIAFSIGGEFKFDHLKQLGSRVVIITFAQALVAMLLVDVVLIAVGFDPALSLALGAIATATAPAATLMVVRQYKAKGPVTQMLLPVVAMDDAVGLMAFSLSIAIASALNSASALNIETALIHPFVEIGSSLAAGIGVGLLLVVLSRWFKSHSNRLILNIAAVLFGVALAEKFELSNLLVCMSIGVTYVNLYFDAHEMNETLAKWTPALYLLFFGLSGAHLDIHLLPQVGLLGILYLVVRSIGKVFGAYIGARISNASSNIRRYLGLMLLPQAGVAIGMVQISALALPSFGSTIQTVVLSATLVYELFGPALTKIALQKAQEITLDA